VRRVYKWPLIEPTTKVPWSPDDRVLLVADQRGTLTLWAEQEDEREAPVRGFTVVGTGHKAPAGLDHVGSAVCGEFVWHVYAEPVETGVE
jgi:hypothetical protein